MPASCPYVQDRARPGAGYIGLVIIIGWVISGVIGIGIALATAYLAI